MGITYSMEGFIKYVINTVGNSKRGFPIQTGEVSYYGRG